MLTTARTSRMKACPKIKETSSRPTPTQSITVYNPQTIFSMKIRRSGEPMVETFQFMTRLFETMFQKFANKHDKVQRDNAYFVESCCDRWTRNISDEFADLNIKPVRFRSVFNFAIQMSARFDIFFSNENLVRDGTWEKKFFLRRRLMNETNRARRVCTKIWNEIIFVFYFVTYCVLVLVLCFIMHFGVNLCIAVKLRSI